MREALVLTRDAGALALAGQIANEFADADVFADFNGRKSANTLRAYRSDLATFADFLCIATNGADCPDPEALQTSPTAWKGVTWGLVQGFVKWMLAQGFALETLNRKLAAVKVYVKLAAEAGVIDGQDAARIAARVKGYSGKVAKSIDTKRKEANIPIRKSAKKAQHVAITPEQAARLKAQPDTPQGRRDALLMCLLLDHGLRVGELAGLLVTDFDMRAGTFTFYRMKVDKTQTHRMTVDTLRAVAAWLHTDAPAIGPVLRVSQKGGRLGAAGISERSITERVGVLGEVVGLSGLSAHDCRHYWASRAASQGTDAFALRDAGGWSSLAMPSRYVEAAAIANERVKL